MEHKEFALVYQIKIQLHYMVAGRTEVSALSCRTPHTEGKSIAYPGYGRGFGAVVAGRKAILMERISESPAVLTGGPHAWTPLLTIKRVLRFILVPQESSY
jgi:hypothetical protein